MAEIDLYLNIFGQARQFMWYIKSPTQGERYLFTFFGQNVISARAAEKQHLDCPI
jgi:hypothetical protein